MTESESKRDRRIAELYRAFQQSFPEVEHVGTTRFLVWGSTRFRHRPYLEIWFDDDFLDRESGDVAERSRTILSEAAAMLNNPDQTIRKQGEILASGRNGITARRGVELYRLDDAPRPPPPDRSDEERPP